MELSQQVVSLELAKRLKELGVKQFSLFYWTTGGVTFRGEMPFFLDSNYSAFTVAELGNMLPPWIKAHHLIITKSSTWFIRYRSPDSFIPRNNEPEIEEEKEADARAKMLIYLIENNLWNNI